MVKLAEMESEAKQAHSKEQELTAQRCDGGVDGFDEDALTVGLIPSQQVQAGVTGSGHQDALPRRSLHRARSNPAQ